MQTLDKREWIEPNSKSRKHSHKYNTQAIARVVDLQNNVRHYHVLKCDKCNSFTTNSDISGIGNIAGVFCQGLPYIYLVESKGLFGTIKLLPDVDVNVKYG